MAELRKQALLASGVKVEGLEAGSSAPSKKISYGNRKRDNKKGAGAAPSSKDASPAPESPQVSERALEPETASPVVEAKAPEPAAKDEQKDDWEASSEDEPVKAADVKDDWDASSEDEAAKKPLAAAPAPTKPSGKGTPKVYSIKAHSQIILCSWYRRKAFKGYECHVPPAHVDLAVYASL